MSGRAEEDVRRIVREEIVNAFPSIDTVLTEFDFKSIDPHVEVMDSPSCGCKKGDDMAEDGVGEF